MNFPEFRREYKLTRTRLIDAETPDLAGAQTQLRQLADQLPSTDQQIAHQLIDGLPDFIATAKAPTPAPSPEMLEAQQVINEANFSEGTREERLAAFDAARKKIWAIADRAGSDSDRIRYMTRRFESTEMYLEEGYPWESPQDSPGT